MIDPREARNLEARMPLPELVAAVRALVARVPGAPESPDDRTIRYYQTLGILDKPARYDGRVALYGPRHLLQAVAIRVLQAQGFSLAQIQRSLAGISTEALEAAVAQAVGPLSLPPVPTAALPTAALPTAALPTVAGPRALRAAEVAPGIHVLIDPALVADPDEAFARISGLFPPNGASR